MSQRRSQITESTVTNMPISPNILIFSSRKLINNFPETDQSPFLYLLFIYSSRNRISTSTSTSISLSLYLSLKSLGSISLYRSIFFYLSVNHSGLYVIQAVSFSLSHSLSLSTLALSISLTRLSLLSWTAQNLPSLPDPLSCLLLNFTSFSLLVCPCYQTSVAVPDSPESALVTRFSLGLLQTVHVTSFSPLLICPCYQIFAAVLDSPESVHVTRFSLCSY